MPGITTHWRVTPTRLGTYPVVCNLLCGLGHSLMRSTIHVVTPAAFRAWIAAAGRRVHVHERLAGRRSRLGRRRGQRIMLRTSDERSRGEKLMAARIKAPGFYRAIVLMLGRAAVRVRR